MLRNNAMLKKTKAKDKTTKKNNYLKINVHDKENRNQ